MKTQFLGAAKEVTGSSILIETRRSKFLLDRGQRQGAESSPGLQINPWEIDFFRMHTFLSRKRLESYLRTYRRGEECKSQPGWGLHRLWLAFEIREKGAYDGWVTTMIGVDDVRYTWWHVCNHSWATTMIGVDSFISPIIVSTVLSVE